jgi:CDP-diacylglycerol--glycerol-3-phosphate 3-phosphatidyltransferase
VPRGESTPGLESDPGTRQPSGVSRAVTIIDRSCRRAIVVGLAAVVIAFAVSFTAGHSPRTAVAFLALSLATWLIVAGTLWRARSLLGPHATRLGAATHVTLLRGLLVSLAAGFAAVSPVGAVRWLPALLYTGAAVCDRFDGIIARHLGQTTALGARLDEAMDALGLLVAPLVAVSWGRLPPWYLLLGVTYYVYRGALWLRRRLRWPVHLDRLERRPLTRIFAGIQMTLVSVALAPLLSLRITTAAATILMMPTLIFFARDWLIAIGRLAPGATAIAPR